MSVCFFVTGDQAGTSTVVEENAETEGGCDNDEVTFGENLHTTLQNFWEKVNADIAAVTAVSEDFKAQALPLARIKKIMKLDEDVKMISAEAPMLFAKAAEIFIHEVTLRAWSHTESNRRRTLQRNDIAMAISKSDLFDFLIDIVPRQEVKVFKPKQEISQPEIKNTSQQVQPPQATQQPTQQPTQVVLQTPTPVAQTSSATTASAAGVVPHPVALVQSSPLVASAGEVQQVKLQLTQSQLNMLRAQLQNNPNQPIIIQPQTAPHLLQVASQSQPVYLAPVATTREESS